MDKFSGLVVSNMIVERNAQKHLVFPDGKAQMREFIAKLQVDQSKDGRFGAAIKGELNIGDCAGAQPLLRLRGRTAGGGAGRPVSAAGYCNNP